MASSYLTPGKEAAVAQKKSAKDAVWPAGYVAKHHADADEEPDLAAIDDFPAVIGNIAAESDACPGPLSCCGLAECENCELAAEQAILPGSSVGDEQDSPRELRFKEVDLSIYGAVNFA